MLFKLINIKEAVAEETIRCDAMAMFSDCCELKKKSKREESYLFPFDFGDIQKLFESRFGKINSGEKYVIYEFVDTDTGEQLDLNCLHGADFICKKHEIYPEYLLKEMKEYYINNF